MWLFLFLNKKFTQVTVSCFIKSLTVKLAHPPGPPAEFDLLEIKSYIEPQELINTFSITKRSIKVGKLYTSILLRIFGKFSERLL